MSDPGANQTSTPAAPTAPAVAPSAATTHTPQSQWALIWREFKKNRLAAFALTVIVLLVSISIWAPFIANDRPLWYRGTNRFDYRDRVRTTFALLGNLADRKPIAAETENSDKTPPDKPASTAKKPSVPNEPPAAVVGRLLDLMEGQLTAEPAEALREFRGRLIPVIEKATADATPEARAELRKLRTELRSKFDGPSVSLKTETSWPVFASLDWGDFTLLVFDLFLVTIPLWYRLVRRLIRADRGSQRTWAAFLVLCGAPLLAGGVWRLAVPPRIDRTPYKDGVPAGDPRAKTTPVVYESVVWPVIPFGLDEDSLASIYLRPALFPDAPRETKTSDSEESGRKAYVPGRWDKPHWLGTDGIGRDLLCRMLWGGRVSLSVGIVATLIEMVLGIVLGSIAGYFRGRVDMVISRIIEIVICFPTFFLILTIVTFVGPSIYNIMIIIGLTGWTGLARLVRGEFLRLADQEFVLSARSLGYSPTRIIFRHILPNAMAPVLVSSTFAIAGAILIESSLSFLGLGITVPKPSWGGILSTGHDVITTAPWIIYFPGLALFVTITSYNLVGEAFRDASDPRLRGRI